MTSTFDLFKTACGLDYPSPPRPFKPSLIVQMINWDEVQKICGKSNPPVHKEIDLWTDVFLLAGIDMKKVYGFGDEAWSNLIFRINNLSAWTLSSCSGHISKYGKVNQIPYVDIVFTDIDFAKIFFEQLKFQTTDILEKDHIKSQIISVPFILEDLRGKPSASGLFPNIPLEICIQNFIPIRITFPVNGFAGWTLMSIYNALSRTIQYFDTISDRMESGSYSKFQNETTKPDLIWIHELIERFWPEYV